MPTFSSLDPNILFQLQQPDIAGGIEQGIKLGAFRRMAPLQEEQQRIANQQAQLTLQDLMNPQSVANKLRQAELEYKQGTVAGFPLERQLQEAQIKNYQAQLDDYYAKENERNRQIAAEQDLGEIAKKYFDPSKKTFDVEGFISESLTKYPLLTADKLLELANKFKYGFGEQDQKSLWKPEGAKVEQNGRLVQPERNVMTGAWRMTDLGPAPVKKAQEEPTEVMQTPEGTFIVGKKTGRIISEVKPGGKSLVKDTGNYITSKNIPTNIRQYWTAEQSVPQSFLKDITGKTSKISEFISVAQQARQILANSGIGVVNPTNPNYAKLQSTMTKLAGLYRDLDNLGVPNAKDAELTTGFIGDPTKLEGQFKNADASLAKAIDLMHNGYNMSMRSLGFNEIPIGSLSKGTSVKSEEIPITLPMYNPSYPIKTDAKGNHWQNINGKINQVRIK